MTSEEEELQALFLAGQKKSVVEWILQNKILNERNDQIEFRDHYFLYDIYNDWTPVQAILKAAQIGFSTMVILKSLYACKVKEYNCIYTLPTQSDVSQFVPEKVNQMIYANPILSSWVQDKDTILQKKVGNRFIYYRGTYTEKEALMLSSDLNVYDEEDRSDSQVIAQYQSRLQFSKYKGEWHFSNPSAPNVGVSKYWNMSDQKHWFIKCRKCGREQYLDWTKNVDKERGEYICESCHGVLSDEDRRVGRWVKKWKREVSGYWINQMMAPWLSCKDLLKAEATKDKQYFYNFVLGLPYIGSDIIIDRDLILRNVTQYESSKKDVCMGVDVGVEKHVVAGTPYGIFAVFKTTDWDEVERFFLKYDATMVIDALPELTIPRKWVEQYKGKVFINYYRSDTRRRQPFEFKPQKEYGVVMTDRTRMIEKTIDELVQGNIKFHLKPDELEEYISHWETLYKVQEEDRLHNTKIRWESSDNNDHFVHATVYYLIAAGRSEEGAVFKERRLFRGKESYFVDESGKIPAISIKEFVGKPKKDWRYT